MHTYFVLVAVIAGWCGAADCLHNCGRLEGFVARLGGVFGHGE